MLFVLARKIDERRFWHIQFIAAIYVKAGRVIVWLGVPDMIVIGHTSR
jgi:hypothetical protein